MGFCRRSVSVGALRVHGSIKLDMKDLGVAEKMAAVSHFFGVVPDVSGVMNTGNLNQEVCGSRHGGIEILKEPFLVTTVSGYTNLQEARGSGTERGFESNVLKSIKSNPPKAGQHPPVPSLGGDPRQKRTEMEGKHLPSWRNPAREELSSLQECWE